MTGADGAVSAVNWAAMYANRAIHEFGLTREMLGAQAVWQRNCAQTNPHAVMRGKALSMEDYLAARMISDPLCLLDCDVPIDGAAAFIVSAGDAARDLPHPPLRIEAMGAGLTEAFTWHQRPDLTSMASHDAAAAMWRSIWVAARLLARYCWCVTDPGAARVARYRNEPMTSRHLVDPELLPALDQFPTLVLDAASLPATRAQIARVAVVPQLSEALAAVGVAEHLVPGMEGAPDVRVLAYTPPNASGRLPGYLHIHGGGYVFGRPDTMDAANRQLTLDAGCIVVSVDYRLAPETPAPGALEDCYAALLWLHGTAAARNVDSKRIAIGGESAGGGLAAALALLARDRGEVTPVLQLLTYPMLDDRTGLAGNANPTTGEFVWTAAANQVGWQALLGDAGRISPPHYAVPARENTLGGLPPACITVGALDLLFEEDIDYAKRLSQAGVPTELHVYPGAYHGFDAFAPQSRVAKAMRRDLVAALQKAFR